MNHTPTRAGRLLYGLNASSSVIDGNHYCPPLPALVPGIFSLRSGIITLFILLSILGIREGVLGQANTFPSTGKVGIGTMSPQAPLEVASPSLTTGIGDVSEMTRFTNTIGNYCQLRFFMKRYSNSDPGWTTASTRIQAYTDVDGQGYIDFNPSGGLYGMAFGTGLPSNGIPQEIMRLTRDGNVGFRTTNPQYAVDINGATAMAGAGGNLDPAAGPIFTSLQNSGKMLVGWNRTAGGCETDFIANRFNGSTAGFSFWDYSNNGTLTNLMNISGLGFVGIGTNDTKGYLLGVNGSAIFNKVVVKAYPWSDYVFDSAYNLASLESVERYVKVNHHLPEVPSADSVEKSGIDIGGNQAVLLKKIEELTLYIIEQNKKVDLLTERVRQLEAKK